MDEAWLDHRQAGDAGERALGEQREAVSRGDQGEQAGHVRAFIRQRGPEAFSAGEHGQFGQRSTDSWSIDPTGIDQYFHLYSMARERVIEGCGDDQGLLRERGHARAGLGQPQRVAGRRDPVDDARVELADGDRASDFSPRVHAYDHRQGGSDQPRREGRGHE